MGATLLGRWRPMESGGHTTGPMAADGEWGLQDWAYGGPWRVGATQIGIWRPMESGGHTNRLMAVHGEWGPHKWAYGGPWRVGATQTGLWRSMESGATQIGIWRPMESGGHTNRLMAVHGEWGPHKWAYGGPWRVGATQVDPRGNDTHTQRQLWSRCCEPAAISFICLAGPEFPRGEFSSVHFKLVLMRSQKPICAPAPFLRSFSSVAFEKGGHVLV